MKKKPWDIKIKIKKNNHHFLLIKSNFYPKGGLFISFNGFNFVWFNSIYYGWAMYLC